MNNRILYKRLLKTPKIEICRMALQTCKHGHNLLSHPQCAPLLNERENLAFFDIETSNLNASFGFIISYCFLSDDGKLFSGKITQNEIRSKEHDKRLVTDCIADLKRFDRTIGHYSIKFDIPFLRTRAVKWGLEFPAYQELLHSDTYDVIKRKFKFHSNRLGSACQLFGIESKTHPLEPDIWQAAMAGNEEAIDYIYTHNVEDVESTRKLWHKISFAIGERKTSI